MSTLPLWQLPVTELDQLMARKALSPVELLDQCLARCDRLNGTLNAIVAFDIEAAREAAQQSEQRMQRGARLGALDGIPVTVKDNLFVKGMPATWGSRLYADFRPAQDDVFVQRLRAAGAVIVGKTNTPEFALASHTDNRVFGKTRNPWNLALSPGGSSGGAVASVAAGLVPLAVGTDSGGSIRRPSGYNGLVGLRPSSGLIPRRFGFPSLAHDFQVIGPTARTIDELHLLLRTIAGPDAHDRASLAFGPAPVPAHLDIDGLPRLRLRLATVVGDAPVDPEIAASVRRAADRMADLGHEVTEGPVPFDRAKVDAIRAAVLGAGVARVLDGRAEGWREEAGPLLVSTVDAGLKLSAIDHVKALDALQQFRVDITAAFEQFDVLLTPTSAGMQWPVEVDHPATIDGRAAGPGGAGMFAGWVNAAGLPGLSIPVEPSAGGMPIGMQLVGGFGTDMRLLTLARQFEREHEWADRWPAFALA